MYIKPDANRQIFSVSRAYAQGGRAVFEADLPGMHFSIKDVSVFIPFIVVDHEGDEPIGQVLGALLLLVPMSLITI
jgi:hypothetical protein